MKQNLIIRASAGTGKTFSLATRFIRLMLFQRVSPERIVALTFSRAAAQEIYMKLLDRLWNAACSERGAAIERDILLQGLSAAERKAADAIDWRPGRFAEILRDVIATQHHGTIATLDSFILKIVRSFPLEMGFQNAVDVLDGFGEKKAVAEAQRALLDGTDADGAFTQAYKLATGGEFCRACSKALGEALTGWRDFLLSNPDCRDWTAASMRAALGVPENPQRPSVDALPVTGKRGDPFGAVVNALETFTGAESVFPKNKGGELMQHLAVHPEETTYTYLTGKGNEKSIVCTPTCAAAIRDIVKYMMDVKLGRVLEVVHAKLLLCRMIEYAYDEATRRRGLLTFSDFTDCQALAERDSESALKLENLQFRFDARFDHWALDEFQDTSALQWLCLRRLVREAAQPGAGRSVMAVGDLKQSIYTWRGGNDAPFKEMMDDWPEFAGDQGEVVPNDISYRYEKHTADFVNRVFGPENVRDSGVLGDESASAVSRWLEDDCWMTHRPDTKAGVEKANDYVAMIAVDAAPDEADGESPSSADEEDSGGAAMKILAPQICAYVADLWREHEVRQSTDTVGILVRNNRDGLALAERLRACGPEGLPVVWEGTSGVLDAPIVRAVLELLKLAEHPEDSFAWQTVHTLFPICGIVFPGITHVGKVSQEVAKMLTRFGLARTLREIVAKLATAPERPDPRSLQRLEALVREGVNYERRRDAARGVLAFADYLATTSGREASASPHVIRILTIHRSKGLTLDHVIVPILETGKTDTIVKPRKGTPLSGVGWAINALPEAEARLNPRIAEAWCQAANERVLEQLRLNYVALTRARKSTHVFVCGDDHAGKVQFRDLLAQPFLQDTPSRECPYGKLLCELGTMPGFGRKEIAAAEEMPWTHAAGDTRVARRSPSSDMASHGTGWKMAAAALFADEGARASERGTLAHARYAAIAWIDPAAPKDETESRILNSPWSAAFVHADGDEALWRERSYELMIQGAWETGQFDRVVFRVAGGRLTAVIYDFKTNARRAGESEAQFATRLCETYAGQMRSYRNALAALTGIPLADIRARLLLEATMGVVDCEAKG